MKVYVLNMKTSMMTNNKLLIKNVFNVVMIQNNHPIVCVMKNNFMIKN